MQLRLERIDTAIGETLPLYGTIAESDLLNPEQSSLIGHLSTACLSSTAAVLLLLENDRVWEAEIPLRSVVEGSLKFAYLLQSRETFASRYYEYVDALPDIAILRSHERAEVLIASSPDPNSPQLQPFRKLLVSQDRIEALRKQYPRRDRGILEQSWSATGIIQSLSQSPGKVAELFNTLLYGYWSASQIAHVTYEGIMMPVERRLREPPRERAVENAHVARILSDCYSYAVIRLHSGLEFVGADLAPLKILLACHQPALSELESFWREWHELEYPEHSWTNQQRD